MNIKILYKTSGLLVLVLIVMSMTGKATTIYSVLAFQAQPDMFITTVLTTGLLVQGIGAIGLYFPSQLFSSSLAFRVLYLISGAELLIYPRPRYYSSARNLRHNRWRSTRPYDHGPSVLPDSVGNVPLLENQTLKIDFIRTCAPA